MKLLSYFITCFLQPIILPIPEPVTIMAGSATFGPLIGAIVGFFGTMAGIVVMFSITKYVGVNIASKMVDKKKLEKFNNYIEKNDTIIIVMLFILPILPDEVICIGSGIAKVNRFKFLIIAMISKLITSISLAYSIEIIKLDETLITIFIIVIMAIVFIKKVKLCERKTRGL